MSRRLVDETSPEDNQTKHINNLKSKIPKGYTPHFSFVDEGKVYQACYNGKEKDIKKAWVRVEV